MERKIVDQIKGFRTSDGAGVSLVRVLSNKTVETYDPILMLDSFDSTNPDDYVAGFPMHPHRGIETVSLIVKGGMVHRDSLGNTAQVGDGEVQWMTAGSGIMHEETLPPSERMLGVQIWLNLPKKDKMAKPEYHSINREDIKEIDLDGGKLRLISGQYKGEKGFQPKYSPLDFYHIILEPNSGFEIEMENDKSLMVFSLLGDGKVAGQAIEEKTAVKLSEGTKLSVQAGPNGLDLLYLSSDRLDEPISWGGPIVMNTREELQEAFRDLENGSFLKTGVDYE